MQFTTTFILLAFTGCIDAGYLFYKHYFDKQPLVCPIGHDCHAVVESRWGNVFFIRNEILGLLFYFGMLSGIIASLIFPSWAGELHLFLLIGSGIGILFSAFFTFLQIFVIKSYCFYCLMSAVITVLIFLNAIFLFR